MSTKISRQQPANAASPGAVALACGVLVLAALAAYHNSFSVPFIYDDSAAITDNPTIQHLWPIWPALSPPPGLTTSGRPIVNLSLAINYALGGVQVGGYHAVNLAIHILAGLTLFGLMRRTLLRSASAGRWKAGALASNVATSSMVMAFAIALIWTLHPLQTAAVTYTVQRAESLMGLFYLLTLYCFVRGTNSNSSGIRPLSSGFWYLCSFLCCLLGMATKEVMVSAPLMVLLYDRTFIAGSFRDAWQKRWRLYLGLAATWLLLACLVAGTGGNRNGSAGFGGGVSSWAYALTQFPAISRYLRLSLWPHPLVFDYGRALVKPGVSVIPYVLIVAVLVAGTLAGLWRGRVLGFAGIWFFAILAPSSSVVPVATETMAEHRMYLPLAAVIALLVLGCHALAGRRSLPVLFGFAILLGFFTLRRNEDYSSALAIWSDTVAKSPRNARAQNQLGFALLQTGRSSEALQPLEEAVRLEPADAEAHRNLGVVLDTMGRVIEAVGQYKEALQIKPDYADAHNSLGNVLARQGRIPEAIGHYEEAVRLNPQNASIHNNLGLALARTGKMAEAIEQFQEALRIKPDYADAHHNLGHAWANRGDVPEAIGELEEALRLNPNDEPASVELARLRALQSMPAPMQPNP
ncbi:MAG TPA: tetratricopeptide repeat protein [Opitutaceae bacterium]|nr:tetratricopeptide repeat protein [Opitutaceae bacterium]